ncbi:malto-oligosyltrehalose trehalohydrolase [Ornithinibacter aureus]
MPIEVWAPKAEHVEIEWSVPESTNRSLGVQPADGAGVPESTNRSLGVQPRRESMTALGDGWWRWDGPSTASESEGTPTASDLVLDYAFVLDGAEPPVPDPRSAWQPHGVHAPSRTFDPATLTWTDGDWRGPRDGQGVLGGVVYELHIGTFTARGTFDAAIERLDHLVDLGVDVVNVMPIAAFDGRWGWGYDGVGLYAVHDPYGGPAAFARFVDACHARGLGVCLDVVHNHLGASGNYLARFGPYFTTAHSTPWGPAVNLDQDHADHVRGFIVDNALRWLRDFHVDALRLDAVHELRDASPRHLLADLSDAVAALAEHLARPLDLIAESDLNDVDMITPTAQGGRGMSAQWDDDIHHALHVTLTGESHGYYTDFAGGAGRDEAGPLAVLAKVLTCGFLHDGSHSSFRGRPWGQPVDTEHVDARRLLGYLQTHDQVGNRMTGDRISAVVPPGLQAAGAALYLLAPTTPMIFMGEEWGASTPWQYFTSFTDEALADAVRAGRRAEFASHGWSTADVPDPQSPATREASVLAWGEVDEAGHRRLLDWYRACIALRRRVIGAGPTRLADVRVDVDEAARTVVTLHAPAGRTASAVVLNLADDPADVPLPRSGGRVALAWDPEGTTLTTDAVRLPGGSAAVVLW